MTDEHDTRAEDLKRRMKAAIALAGITVEELAERIDRRGYGAKTHYNLQGEAGGRPILAQDQEVIAKACGLSPAFFTIDFSKLQAPADEDRIATLERQMAAVLQVIQQPDAPDALDLLQQALADLDLAPSPSRGAASSAAGASDHPPGRGEAGAA
jgi:hypothetical protein